MKVNFVVVDSGPIIKGAALETFSEHAISVPGVIKEIKDLKTRQRVRALPPYFFSIRSPSEEAIKYVTSISKKSGDYKVLSKVDIEVLALAYEMQYLKTYEEIENMFEKMILDSDFEFENVSEEPGICEENESDADSLDNTDDSEDDSDSLDITSSNNEEKAENHDQSKESDNIEDLIGGMKISEEAAEERSYTVEAADDNGWITPDNFEEMKSNNFGMTNDVEQVSIDNLPEIPKIGCLTTDFAMQNVLLHMKIPILSVGGMLVKEPRIFITICRSCFKQFRRVDIYFCPYCGNENLGKIPAKISENGAIQLFLKKNFQPNLRHTKFTIPTPKGGKHLDGNSYIYCADQRLPQERSKKSKCVIDPYDDSNLSFAVHDVSAKSSVLGINHNRNGPLKPSRPRGNKGSRFKK